VVAETSAFLEPAPAVPVPAEIRRLLGNDNDVADSGVDDRLTTRADVRLARLIRLDRMNHLMFVPRQRRRHVGIRIVGHVAMVRLQTRNFGVPDALADTGSVEP
jgi:hypothetical protein